MDFVWLNICNISKFKKKYKEHQQKCNKKCVKMWRKNIYIKILVYYLTSAKKSKIAKKKFTKKKITKPRDVSDVNI